MRCNDILPLVERLADGECTEPDRARAEAHLAECESCQEHFRFVQALPGAARKAPLPEPPGAYWDALPRKVMARIEREQAARMPRGWFSQILAVPRLRWLGALAAGAIAVVLSYEVMTLEKDGPPVTAEDSVVRPVLEESLPDEATKTTPDVMGGGTAERTDQERVRRQRPAASPSERRVVAPPAPGRAPMESSGGLASPLPESKGEADLRTSPGRVSNAVGVEGRDEAPPETEEEPTVAMAEGVNAPEEVRAPSAPRPEEPKLEAARLSRAKLAARETELEDYRVLKQATREPKGVDTVAFSDKDRETTAVNAADRQAECRALRDSIDPSSEISERERRRYELALCSIALYELRQTEDDRTQAREDCSAYLESFPEGAHVEEIRELLEQISRQ